jgi:predicted transcriptional regulator
LVGKKENMMGNEGVIAVEKALALLDCFRPGNDSLTLTELAQLSGYHKTTVYRLMNSLERMNYIIRHDDGTYTLGHRLLYLGKLYEQSFELARVVQPELQALSQASSESASWYVIEGGQRLCLFRAEASRDYATATCPAASSRWMVPLSARFYATGDWVNRCRKTNRRCRSIPPARATRTLRPSQCLFLASTIN